MGSEMCIRDRVIIFSKSNLKANKLPNKLIIDDKRVPFSTHTKYLRVTLDNKLLWTQQWLNVIKTAKAYIFTIIPFISRTWGPRPIYTKWVYTTIIRPCILYAFFTWGHMIGQGKRREALGSINKLAAKMIVPIRHTTPRHSLEIIFDLIPLDIQGTYEALASLTRQELALTQTWIGKHPKCNTYVGHRRYWYLSLIHI